MTSLFQLSEEQKKKMKGWESVESEAGESSNEEKRIRRAMEEKKRRQEALQRQAEEEKKIEIARKKKKASLMTKLSGEWGGFERRVKKLKEHEIKNIKTEQGTMRA